MPVIILGKEVVNGVILYSAPAYTLLEIVAWPDPRHIGAIVQLNGVTNVLSEIGGSRSWDVRNMWNDDQYKVKVIPKGTKLEVR